MNHDSPIGFVEYHRGLAATPMVETTPLAQLGRDATPRDARAYDG